MPEFDNPAGRLHALLTDLSAQPAQNSVIDSWTRVLGLSDREETVLHLGEVGQLLPEIEREVDRIGDDTLIVPVRRLRQEWSRPIFPMSHAFEGALREVLPSPPSLETLALVSSNLHLRAPQGAVPDDEALAALVLRVQEVMAAVSESEDLPNEVRRVILLRLGDVIQALGSVRVGGPGVVQKAVEALVGAIAMESTQHPEVRESELAAKVWKVVWPVWAAFASGPLLQDSIEAWGNIATQLLPG